jgi:hypothetical protein
MKSMNTDLLESGRLAKLRVFRLGNGLLRQTAARISFEFDHLCFQKYSSIIKDFVCLSGKHYKSCGESLTFSIFSKKRCAKVRLPEALYVPAPDDVV